MKPFLFTLFGVKIDSYATFMTLAYVAALAAIFAVVPKNGDDKKGELSRIQAWDLYIVMLLSSLLGSKIGHVLFEAPGHKTEDGRTLHSLWELMVEDPWHWARLGEAGYVWYGGLIGALGTALYYFWRRPHLRAWLYADALAASIMFGAFVGRIGCFLAGCCYGRVTDLPWGVHFPGVGGYVHPTQLYDSFVGLVLGSFLLWRFPRRRFEGESIALMLIGYSVARAFTEYFRGDPERGGLGAFSTSQLLSIPLFGIGLFLYGWLKKRPQPPVEGVTLSPTSATIP